MLQPIPRSTAIGHWPTLNWLSTTTWPIAIMICRLTDDQDVGRYVKIASDLVHLTDQSGISTLRMRLEKKICTGDEDCRPYVTPLIPCGYSTDGSLIDCWHTTNAMDTQSTLCLTLDLCIVSNMYTDSWPRYWPIHQSTPLLWHMTAARLAQLGECRSAEREVASSNPGQTNTQGLNNNWGESAVFVMTSAND